MRLPGLPSVRLTDVPTEVAGGEDLPVAFEVSTKRGGVLACEVSLWCSLLTPTGGFRWPPETRLSAEVVKVVLDPTTVGPGRHRQAVTLALPADARPTVRTAVGKVRYELNVVASVDGRRGAANREVVVRSTQADPGVPATVEGDEAWDIAVELPPAHVGGQLEGTVRIEAAERSVVAVDARLEHLEAAAEVGEEVRWSAESSLGSEVAVAPGSPVTLPVRFDLPPGAPPTVLMRSFTQRWAMTVTVSDGTRRRRVTTGAVVLS